MTAESLEAKPEPQVVAAARRAVEKHGYGGLSLERIAVEAGVSRVTLHRRGFTPEEIFDELVDQTLAEGRDELWPVLASEGSGADRLRLGLGAICDRCERDLDVMVALGARADARCHTGGAGPSVFAEALAEPLAVMVRDGVADGSLREVDLEGAGTLVLTSVAGTYVRLRCSFGWKRRRTREVVIELTLAAFSANSDVES